LAQSKFTQEQVRRYGALLKDGIVTQDQYDQLRANADAYEATIAADRAAVDTARLQLGYCFIRSPLDGRTGNLMVQQGNLVKANDNPVLVTINQLTPIYATFSVPERDMVDIRKYLGKGVKVEAFITGDEGKAESGVLSFLDNAVDTATGTIKLKATFPNKARRLWPGQFVSVLITLSIQNDAVVVPTQAIQTGQQGQYVFVVRADKTVEMRPISAGIAYNNETVITKGLKAGETLVTDGQVRLVPGAKVDFSQGDHAVKAGSNPTISPSLVRGGQGKTR
jgi:multidrug efflux system membrane fusion protein